MGYSENRRHVIQKPNPKEFIKRLQQSLNNSGIDYTHIIDEFGQVKASEDRISGKQFILQDHIQGLILSLLSNQRPWGPIAQNITHIGTIFFNYNPNKLIGTHPDYFVKNILEIKCGNRQIKKQMMSLKENINTLILIENDNKSIDSFITSDNPDIVAKKLSKAGRYKLNQVGYTLALEYLRNVGIRAGKPDIHIRRILSRERLGYFNNMPSEVQAYNFIDKFANIAGCNPTYLDNLIWLLCAKNYGNICGSKPMCSICSFVNSCNFPL